MRSHRAVTSTFGAVAVGMLIIAASIFAGATATRAVMQRGHQPDTTPPKDQHGHAHGDKPGGGHEGMEGHVHAGVPPEYRGARLAPEAWTDPTVLARGRAIYEARCAVCHGDAGDGKGPAAASLPLKPPDMRDAKMIEEMTSSYWFWRVSEGGFVEPFVSKGSVMPAWKDILPVEDRWAVIAYQHTLSGHQGPHEHPMTQEAGHAGMGQPGRASTAMPSHGGHGDMPTHGRASAMPSQGGHETKPVHMHAEIPSEYRAAHVPAAAWTHPAMLERGRGIYAARCAVCHGDTGDGKGPAAASLPVKPPDLRDAGMIAEMAGNYWFWRVSEGGLVEPFRSQGSTMPAWKNELSVEDRWAVIAYQHTFSGHQAPHVTSEHPQIVAGAEAHRGMEMPAKDAASQPAHGAAGQKH